ncbi:MAG: hypothetical protein LBG97_07390 [Coriobacteriales bacterium]|jgi:hypothetical protein|nr:hypothetical protein [Coriobacteriales bacterium]
MVEILSNSAIVSFAIAALCFLVAIYWFYSRRIIDVRNELNGKTAAREIAKIRQRTGKRLYGKTPQKHNLNVFVQNDNVEKSCDASFAMTAARTCISSKAKTIAALATIASEAKTTAAPATTASEAKTSVVCSNAASEAKTTAAPATTASEAKTTVASINSEAKTTVEKLDSEAKTTAKRVREVRR